MGSLIPVRLTDFVQSAFSSSRVPVETSRSLGRDGLDSNDTDRSSSSVERGLLLRLSKDGNDEGEERKGREDGLKVALL